MKRVRHNPRYIIFWAVTNYLTVNEEEGLISDLVKQNPIQDRKFLRIVSEHFNFEKFITSPYLKEDAWLYNYMLYELDGKMKRRGLINRYDREVLIPAMKITDKLKEIIYR
jgi:hypothetical protein